MKRQQKLEQVKLVCKEFRLSKFDCIFTLLLYLLIYYYIYFYIISRCELRYLLVLNFFHHSAGTGAAENRRGAGEHPRVREDEEQPAQNEAGNRRRETNHLKSSAGCWSVAH